MAKKITLSVLIPTVPSRLKNHLPNILQQFNDQIAELGRDDVEVLAFYDNKKRTIGEKRNSLISIANGDFVVFIDDDDAVAEDYLYQVLDVIKTHPDVDCIVYDCLCHLTQPEGIYDTYCKYGIEYDYWRSADKTQWTGLPAHTMVYRASLARNHSYEDISEGEDVSWVKRASKDIKKQIRIEKVLYYYDADYSKSER